MIIQKNSRNFNYIYNGGFEDGTVDGWPGSDQPSINNQANSSCLDNSS